MAKPNNTAANTEKSRPVRAHRRSVIWFALCGALLFALIVGAAFGYDSFVRARAVVKRVAACGRMVYISTDPPDLDVQTAIAHLGGSGIAALRLRIYLLLSRDADDPVAKLLLDSCEKPLVPTLIRALGDSRRRVWEAAALSLTRLGPEAVPALVDTLSDATTAEMRVMAASVLGRIGPAAREAVPALIRQLGDPEVRAIAAGALGGIGPDAREAVPKLINRLNDPSPLVRQFVVKGLVGIDPSPALVPLLLPLLEDNDTGVREVAAQSLGKIGAAAPTVVPALISALGDPGASVRVVAAAALGKIGPVAKAAVPELKRLAAGDPESSVRVTARAALEKIRGSGKNPAEDRPGPRPPAGAVGARTE